MQRRGRDILEDKIAERINWPDHSGVWWDVMVGCTKIFFGEVAEDRPTYVACRDHSKQLRFYSWCSGKPLSNNHHLNAVWKRVGRKLGMKKENQ